MIYNSTKCPHCGVKLGPYLWADACPHCHHELEQNTRPLVAMAPKRTDCQASWLRRNWIRLVRFIES